MSQPLGTEGPLALALKKLLLEMDQGDLTLGEIFEILKGSGHSVLILFLCLPFMQPIPLLGLSTPMGLLIGIVALFDLLGRAPWIPKSWARRDLSGKTLRKILEVAETLLQKIEKWIHPRGAFWVRSWPSRLGSFFLLLSCGLLLALPLPVPFSNTVPAWTAFLHCLGKLEDDGLLVFVSYFLFVLCVAFFVLLALGVETGIGLFAPSLEGL